MAAFGLTYVLGALYVVGTGLFVMKWHSVPELLVSTAAVLGYLLVILVLSVCRAFAIRYEIEPLSQRLYGKESGPRAPVPGLAGPTHSS